MNARPWQSLVLIPAFLLAGTIVSAADTTSRTAPAPAPLVADAQHSLTSSADAAAAYQITSAILGDTRQIYVALPASYTQSDPQRRYPVAIVFDGEANIQAAGEVARALAANGHIPELILVGIANVPGRSYEEEARRRVYDLTPPGLSVSGSNLEQGGDRFLDFIQRELLPAVDGQLRGGAPRVLIGHSSGAILATWAAATRPAFRAIVAIDTPSELGSEWLPQRLLARARSDSAARSPAIRYASYEARFGWRDDTWQMLAAAAPASWHLHREQLAHETHESMGMLSMYLGLREVFGDYSALAAPVSPTTSTLPYYARIDSAMGGQLVPPRRLLRNVIEDLLAEGRGAVARDAYRTLAWGYGAPGDSTELLAQIAAVMRRPPPTETVEGLLATPFPTPDEARAYLGEWEGSEWVADEPPGANEQTLRIWIENGHVLGETVYADAPPEYRVQRWEYFKITPHGITWGKMNGMRPRGVILNEGTLRGEVLTGDSRFGGIDFRLPDGSRPPVHHFKFRRAKK